MKQIRLLIMALVLCLPTLSYATDPPTWIGPTTINSIYTTPNGLVYLGVNAQTPNLECPSTYSNGWLELDTAAPRFKEQFSLLLAALMAGKQIEIYVDQCGAAYPYVQFTKVMSN